MRANYKKMSTCLAGEFQAFHGDDPTKRREELLDYFQTSSRFRRVLSPKLRAAFPWLSSRAGTDDDIREFCEREEIMVVYDAGIKAGVYINRQGVHAIFLNSELGDQKRRYVMFHEIGHYLFHGPSTVFIHLSTGELEYRPSQDKRHLEAEIVAGLCNSAANHFAFA